MLGKGARFEAVSVARGGTISICAQARGVVSCGTSVCGAAPVRFEMREACVGRDLVARHAAHAQARASARAWGWAEGERRAASGERRARLGMAAHRCLTSSMALSRPRLQNAERWLGTRKGI